MIYDSFTITVALQLEDLGIIGRGQAGGLRPSRNMDLGGTLPLNTDGGLLSCAHPARRGGHASADVLRGVNDEISLHIFVPAD